MSFEVSALCRVVSLDTMEGHVAGAGRLGGSGWQVRRRTRQLHRHAPRQGRPGGPQRRGQDELLQSARWRGRSHPRQGVAQGRLRLSAPRATDRRSPRESQRGDPRAVRPRHRRGDGADREAPHRDGRGRQRPQRRPLLQGPGRVRVVGWLLGRERGAQHRRRPGAEGRPPRAADRCALGWRASSRRAVADPVRRQRCAVARRADEPPRHRRKGVVARLHALLPWRVAGHQPRPRSARRGDHSGAPPRPAGRGRHGRGGGVQGHLQPVPHQSRPPTRSAWPARQHCRPRRSPGCRPWSIASGQRQPRRRWRTARRSRSPAWRPIGCT